MLPLKTEVCIRMDPVVAIVAFAAGILILWLVCRLLSFPLKVVWKLLLNAVLGAVALFLFDLIGGFFDVSLPINWLNALVAGVFGVPGVILLLILQYIL